MLLPSSVFDLIEPKFLDSIGGEIESSSRKSIYVSKAEKVIKHLKQQGKRKFDMLNSDAEIEPESNVVECKGCSYLDNILKKSSCTYKVFIQALIPLIYKASLGTAVCLPP